MRGSLIRKEWIAGSIPLGDTHLARPEPRLCRGHRGQWTEVRFHGGVCPTAPNQVNTDLSLYTGVCELVSSCGMIGVVGGRLQPVAGS